MKDEYISDEYVVVSPDEPAMEVTKKLTAPNILTAIVLDDEGKIVGAIIKNSLLDLCIVKKKDSSSITAKEIMGSIESIEENTEFLNAIKLMIEKSAKALAITKKGKLRGVLSIYDALALLYKIQTHRPEIFLPGKK